MSLQRLFFAAILAIAVPVCATAGAALPIPVAGDTTELGYRVDSIDVMPAGPCPDAARPICSTDSIRVVLRGSFPNDCFSIRKIELLPSIITGPLPQPPTIRFVADDGSCLDRACVLVVTPWEAMVTLPPLPAREYLLQLIFERSNCTDSTLAFVTRSVPFRVTDRCGTTGEPCLLPFFDHPNGFGNCDATISPDGSAQLTFEVSSVTPLAGLQGEFSVDPTQLAISHLEAIGPAAGMHVSWVAISGGVRFLMFSERGAPIAGDRVPVLRVTLAPTPAIPIPITDRVAVAAQEIFGSALNGTAVPTCVPPPCVRLYIEPPRAIVCFGRACDVNADGHSDVRDLVLMVRCLQDPDCGASDLRHFDCNVDGDFSLDDVICCARRILGPPTCRVCPPDTIVRKEDGVRLELGPPVFTATGVDVPLTLVGLEKLGAARITLQYPRDRFDLANVDFTAAMSDWLSLSEPRDGEIAIGVVQMFRPAAQRDDFSHSGPSAMLHLRLRTGREVGGEVAATSAEFSAPDGVLLDVGFGRPAVRLGGPIALALSTNRPNPFTGATEFALTLDRGASVELGVYDIGGRLVASIHRGLLAAGPHDFRWNGRDASGSVVRGGIYFIRAIAGEVTVTRKVVLIGAR